MNTLESKLTTALRETAAEVPSASVPPLRLPPERQPGLPRGGRRHRWLARMTPLAAAAAVAGVVAGSLAISSALHGTSSPTRPAAGPLRGAPVGGPGALRRVPPYYAGLADPSDIMGGMRAVIRSSRTGAVLATVRPPRPFGLFTWVSAAADDHTFVLAAQRYWPIARGNRGLPAERRDGTTPTRFFKLSFLPSTGQARLTGLAFPRKVAQSEQLAGMAVSPDGSKLALDLRRSIQVISLATGATRTWRGPGGGGWAGNWKPYGQVLSWSADGKELAFQQWGGKYDSTAYQRVLDTAAPGSSLLSAKLVATFPNKSNVLTLGGVNALLTADGSKIVAPTMTQAGQAPYATRFEITEFSVPSGQVVRTMDQFRMLGAQHNQELLWTSASGGTVIVTDPRGKHYQLVSGVLSGGRFTPLPGNPQYQQIAW